MSESRLKVFSGNSNKVLAEDICRSIGVPLGQATVTSFPDGETFVKIDENIRGHDVFIVQSTCPPSNQHLMELLIMIDAARRASADRITAVLPFYGYARQDRKDQPRVPITAKLVANTAHAVSLTDDLDARGFFIKTGVGGYLMEGIKVSGEYELSTQNGTGDIQSGRVRLTIPLHGGASLEQ